MSRMLACLAPHATTLRDALPDGLLEDFQRLALLHGDGSGIGTTGGVPLRTVRLPGGPFAWDDAATPRLGFLLYLRFASRGAAVAPENVQPFLAGGLLFQHNGAFASRDLGLLTAGEQEELRGATDSEIYFALVRRACHGRTDGGADEVARAVAATVRDVRHQYPVACLNAMMLAGDDLVVVQSAGSAPTPLEAFAARGADLHHLPSGHDGEYNRMFTIQDARTGVRVVATTGVDVTGWQPLPDDTVTVYRGTRAVACAL